LFIFKICLNSKTIQVYKRKNYTCYWTAFQEAHNPAGVLQHASGGNPSPKGTRYVRNPAPASTNSVVCFFPRSIRFLVRLAHRPTSLLPLAPSAVVGAQRYSLALPSLPCSLCSPVVLVCFCSGIPLSRGVIYLSTRAKLQALPPPPPRLFSDSSGSIGVLRAFNFGQRPRGGFLRGRSGGGLGKLEPLRPGAEINTRLT
jgi:hypothetical protein